MLGLAQTLRLSSAKGDGEPSLYQRTIERTACSETESSSRGAVNRNHCDAFGSGRSGSHIKPVSMGAMQASIVQCSIIGAVEGSRMGTRRSLTIVRRSSERSFRDLIRSSKARTEELPFGSPNLRILISQSLLLLAALSCHVTFFSIFHFTYWKTKGGRWCLDIAPL